MSEQAETQAQTVCKTKYRHSARAQDERGVSIWAESRMRAWRFFAFVIAKSGVTFAAHARRGLSEQRSGRQPLLQRCRDTGYAP